MHPEATYVVNNSTPNWTASLVSILNGLCGDYLRDRQNGLALSMALYAAGRPLALTPAGLQAALPAPTGKICLFVHGLGCHEGIWTYRGQDAGADTDTDAGAAPISYGSLLRAEAGYTPLYLRYNTGLPIEDNGRLLAALIAVLLACYPRPVEELMLVGHSMGGLVLRSAARAAAEQGAAWPALVSRVIYLGTPHAGADLEQIGHLATTTLQGIPSPVTRLIGDVLAVRSRGIKDLRLGAAGHGAHDAAGAASDRLAAAGWPAGVQHYFIAGALHQDPDHRLNALVGDGLVRAFSSLAPAHAGDAAAFPPDHTRVIAGVDHLRLARDPAVYRQIKAWCTAP